MHVGFGCPPLLDPDEDVVAPLDPDVVVPLEEAVAPLEDVVAPDDAPDEDDAPEDEDVERTSWSDAPPQASAIVATEPMKAKAGKSRMRPS